MWVAFVICLISIPVFYYYDNRQISETDLLEIGNLTLAQSPDYLSGKRPRININLTNTDRTLVVNLEELNCVTKDEILSNFKRNDTISIKIFIADKEDFYKTGIISKFQKIYGLKKNGQEYIQLACRNSVSTKKTIAAIYASCATAILSFILAILVFRPNIKFGKKGIIYSDPITVVCFCWFLVLIIAIYISR
jgi:hypothetical protein